MLPSRAMAAPSPATSVETTVMECFRALLEAVLSARCAVPGNTRSSSPTPPTPPPPTTTGAPITKTSSTSAGAGIADRHSRQHAWFNLTAGRLDVNLHGLSTSLVLELADEATGVAFETWSAWYTPMEHDVDDDLVAAAAAVTLPSPPSSSAERTRKMRAYFRLMVLLRSISSVACVLPGHEMARRVRQGGLGAAIASSLSVHRDAVRRLPDAQQDEKAYAFPTLETERGGKFNVCVVYKSAHALRKLLRTHASAAPPTMRAGVVVGGGGPEILEDYLMATPARDPNPYAAAAAAAAAAMDDTPLADYDEEEELQRWTRWTAASFDERERELAQDRARGGAGEDAMEGDTPATPESPPMGAFPRVTSNPMAIPTANNGGGNNANNYSAAAAAAAARGGVVPYHHAGSASSLLHGLARHGSSNFALTGGHSISELVAFSTTGTPILSSLPFAVGSLGDSEGAGSESNNTPNALRARFLSSVTMSSLGRSPPAIFGSSLGSQRNLLMDAPAVTGGVARSSGRGGGSLLPHPAATAAMPPATGPSSSYVPVFPTTTAAATAAAAMEAPPSSSPPPPAAYGAALPWILSAAEKENPFASSMLGSLMMTDPYVPPGPAATTTTTTTATTATTPDKPRGPSSSSPSREPRHDIDFSDDTDLPFAASSDSDNEMGEVPAPDEQSERETFLGTFVKRCHLCPEVYPAQALVMDTIKQELDALVHSARAITGGGVGVGTPAATATSNTDE